MLIGSILLGGAGAAAALTPRQRLNLLGDADLEEVVPTSLGGWQVSPSNAVILPEEQQGGLAAQLYNQTLSRLYTGDGLLPIMLVIAYGDTQSDLLQLHRPETCYTAIGFEITRSERVDLTVGGARLPMRALTARANQRVEPILYWTRLGDELPTTGREQRLMKLRSEWRGYVADGVLVRLSTIADPTPEVFASLQAFARALILAVPREVVPALVGRPMAERIGAAGLAGEA